MRLLRFTAVLAVTMLIAGGSGLAAPAQEVAFTSNQFTPVTEQEWARNTLLSKFTEESGIRVQFTTENEGPYVDRLLAETKAGKGTIDVTGTLHGIFPVFLASNAIVDMTPVQQRLDARKDRTFFSDLLKVSKMEGIQAFVPWMQATYLLAARKDALKYFPAGRDPMRMTYDDLLRWGENIKQATGQRRIGFPAGPRGLYGRFLHGYVYPSFTGSQVKRFKSPEAVEMWRYLRRLWGVTHPSSFTYEFMAQPLLLGEVWVAWDHIARLLPALQERADDFVVLPSPAGPKGRSFLAVVVGLAIPKTADNPDLGERLIEYLTRPATQIMTAQGVAFFPVSPEAAKATPTGGLKVVADGASAQAGAADARTALLPVGLGARTGEFVPLYVDTFRRIAIQGEDIPKVLADQGAKLDELYRTTNAPCAPPDPVQRPCLPD